MPRYLARHHPELFAHKPAVVPWQVGTPVPVAGMAEAAVGTL